MINKKRDIYIKVEETKKIVLVLSKIQEIERSVEVMFENYDKLDLEENKIFENWSNYFEEIDQKLENITL